MLVGVFESVKLRGQSVVALVEIIRFFFVLGLHGYYKTGRIENPWLREL